MYDQLNDTLKEIATSLKKLVEQKKGDRFIEYALLLLLANGFKMPEVVIDEILDEAKCDTDASWKIYTLGTIARQQEFYEDCPDD